MLKFTTAFCCLLMTVNVYSQKQIAGKVNNINRQAITNAIISDLQNNTLTQTDSQGRFSMFIDNDNMVIVISHKTYQSDTITIGNQTELSIVLKSVQVFEGFKVESEGGRNSQLAEHTIKTERIGQGELKKAACCDLAGCFETQGSVQPMTTNVITNSKELRILGLSGVYNQVLFDGIPMMYGLAYTYGISSIPGTLVDNIFVAKGSTSVLQGFEGMVGQINVIPKSPDKGEKVLLNMYVNSFGENQHNLNIRFKKGKWSNLLALHVVQPAAKWDRDKDGFLDLPLLKRYLLFDKIKYGDESKDGLNASIGFKIFKEERVGGQSHFSSRNDLGSTKVYGQKIDFTQAELLAKAGYRFGENKKISWMSSAVLHDQNSWFGSIQYKASQVQLYSNIQYEWIWNRNHELRSGASIRYLNIPENIQFTDTFLHRTYQGDYLKRETIPGVFAENTFKWKGDILTLITGIRADHHSEFGWQITPRAMLKYDLTEKAVLRASAGSGWRTVNLFSENIGLLVSSRDIIFTEKPAPEKAMNWGVNFLQKFKLKKLEGFFTIDFYQTRFSRQFFPDYDKDPNKAFIYNYMGNSVSNGFQTDWNFKLRKIWEVKLVYNYLDVYRVNNGIKTQLPFNSKHKFLVSWSFVPSNKKWRIDLNAHWFGEQRLPDTDLNPIEYRQAKNSKSYTTFNLQLTRNWKNLELYGGCENLFDYRQLRPIVSWQNPYSPYFDTSFNWGPTRGREIYAGFRWKIF